MPGYDVVDIAELEGRMKKVRKALDVQAFGVNYGELGRGEEGHEHDELRAGHEEVYFLVKGSGHLHVDGERVEARAGVAVRLDPEVRRHPVAGDEGLAWIAIGAPRDGKYEPPSWG